MATDKVIQNDLADNKMVTSKTIAMELNVTTETVNNMCRQKRMPEAIKLSPNNLRWYADEIRAWIENGCPKLANWKIIWRHTNTDLETRNIETET